MWEDELACPSCNMELVSPIGPKQSPILFIGAHPGLDELRYGKAFSGPNGNILRKELGYLSVDLGGIRCTNLWQHQPTKTTKTNKDQVAACFQYGLQYVLKERKDKQLIVLFGAEPVKYFCDVSVGEYSGLQVESTLLGTKAIIMACIQPADVFKGGLGEVRLSIKKIANEINELRLFE